MRSYVNTVLVERQRFIVLLLISLYLIAMGFEALALTAETVMDNVLEVYEDIEDYAAVVHTYSADSMDVSGSVFENQPPRVAFNLFFRKPDEHAVEEIGDSRQGIFRIELLSTLVHLTRLEMRLRSKMFLLGRECHVLEVVDPDKLGDKAVLWISPREWKVLQLTLFIKSIEFARTRFTYVPGNTGNPLPIETRSFFPISNQILINRVEGYRINIGLPSEVFEVRQAEEATK